MLIVNDVGDVGIDGSLMRQLDTDVYEIFLAVSVGKWTI